MLHLENLSVSKEREQGKVGQTVKWTLFNSLLIFSPWVILISRKNELNYGEKTLGYTLWKIIHYKRRAIFSENEHKSYNFENLLQAKSVNKGFSTHNVNKLIKTISTLFHNSWVRAYI